MKRFFLLPGKIAVSKEATEISTNLGSCVAVCLHDPRVKLGGMCHYLLPTPPEGYQPSLRFGNYAIKSLFHQMIESGASPKNLQAKIYGGGRLLEMAIAKNVGEKNISLAEQVLGELKIPIMESQVGGEDARRIVMRTDNFSVQCESHKASANETDITGYRPAIFSSKVTVAVVDDHPAIQKLYENIFKKHGLEVVGTAGDAFEARKLIVEKKPMAITLDIEMPQMSGVDFLEKLMKHFPTPVVMVSHLDSQGEQALRALELGAVEFVQKPVDLSPTALREMAESLVEKVKAAAAKGEFSKSKISSTASEPHFGRNFSQKADLILIGGNTGSPPALKNLLRQLPASIPPVVVANSTLSHFLHSFVENLQGETKLNLNIASGRQVLEPGNVYFIPKATDGSIAQRAGKLELALSAAPSALQSPSIDALFESGAKCEDTSVVGLLLSSFGNGGLKGLERLAEAKKIVMVQSPSEAQLGGTILKAIASGFVDYVVSSEQLLELLRTHGRRKAA